MINKVTFKHYPRREKLSLVNIAIPYFFPKKHLPCFLSFEHQSQVSSLLTSHANSNQHLHPCPSTQGSLLIGTISFKTFDIPRQSPSYPALPPKEGLNQSQVHQNQVSFFTDSPRSEGQPFSILWKIVILRDR